MKRSQINDIMRKALAFAEQMNFLLPPFVHWSPQDWQNIGQEYDEIRDNMLGWDITDFGGGDYDKLGLLMITLRNGSFDNESYVKPYAEKLLIVQEEQVTPYHFHWSKMEDIINRGRGNLMIKVYGSTEDEALSQAPVMISKDGCNYEVEAGTIVKVLPGESLAIPARQYHKFWGEKGTGTVLVGEVSKVNDDFVDNRFLEKMGRFPKIEEDEEPLHLLYNEYPAAK
ncbi:MAG: D-lyxose/D-mannose family sugar isomerase [Clostridia bacterium]|jgi:D-lyxose ketol-isomerase|nr:D-lyxose/D-mannose family sugar isomerase [Clostridia bacterium]